MTWSTSQFDESGNFDKFDMHENNQTGHMRLAPRFSDWSVKKFCDRITCHGLREISESTSYLGKAFWSLLFLICLFALAANGYYEVYEYLYNPILTSTLIEPKHGLPFPYVYICPASFTDWDYVRACSSDPTAYEKYVSRYYGEFGELSDSWQKVASKLGPIPPLGGGYAPLSCPEVPENETEEQYLKRHAFSIDMFIRQCNYEAIELNCSQIVTKLLDKQFGVCYMVNISNSMMSLSQGRTHQRNEGLGLVLVLDIQSELTPSDALMKTQIMFDGVLVRTQHLPDPGDITGSYIAPGTRSKLSLTAQQRKLLAFSTSETPQNCRASSKRNFKIISNETEYSRMTCRTDCFMYYSAKYCDCIPTFDSTYLGADGRSLRFCNQTDIKGCFFKLFGGSRYDEITNCTKSCFSNCFSTEISASLSFSKFPAIAINRRGQYVDNMRKMQLFMAEPPSHFISRATPIPTGTTRPIWPDNLVPFPKMPVLAPGATVDIEGKFPFHTSHTSDYDFLQYPNYKPTHSGPLTLFEYYRFADNIIILEIAFDKLEYVIFEQSMSRTIVSLVSSIGGQAGLWTGASIFTFVQASIFCISMASSKKIERVARKTSYYVKRRSVLTTGKQDDSVRRRSHDAEPIRIESVASFPTTH